MEKEYPKHNPEITLEIAAKYRELLEAVGEL